MTSNSGSATVGTVGRLDEVGFLDRSRFEPFDEETGAVDERDGCGREEEP